MNFCNIRSHKMHSKLYICFSLSTSTPWFAHLSFFPQIGTRCCIKIIFCICPNFPNFQLFNCLKCVFSSIIGRNDTITPELFLFTQTYLVNHCWSNTGFLLRSAKTHKWVFIHVPIFQISSFRCHWQPEHMNMVEQDW